jgi:LuxR family transcriptional regulator, maltose regulon positive regulatory protein
MRTSASTPTVTDRALTAVVTTRARSAESIVNPDEWFPVSARLPGHNPQETPSRKLAPVRDGPVPRVQLLWAAALLLLEAIASDALGDSDASALAVECDLGLAEPLFPALIRAALGQFERRASEATPVLEIAGLLGEVKRPAPPSAGPAWPAPGEPLTGSEIRVLRYLPTHLGAPEIAAELYLSANTVRTHLRHLYRKLGAHSRHEAVQRARAIGLLAASSGRPSTAGPSHSIKGQTRSA